MTRESFKSILEIYREITKDIDDLYEVGLDLVGSKYRISEKVESLFNETMLSDYTVDGVQWISWFTGENDWGDRHYEAHDTEGNLIAQTIDDLFDLLEKNYKIQNKKVFGKKIRTN